MIALAVVLAVIVLLALLRFGVFVEYGEEGLFVKAQAGPIRIAVLPRKEKAKTEKSRRKDEKKKAKRALKKEEKAKEKAKEGKPGTLQGFLGIVKVVKDALGRLRRRLLIKNLTIYFTAAGDDPARTAMMFGGTNAVFATIMPGIDSVFRVKRRDMRAYADFTGSKPRIYAKAAISIALWEIIYVALALLPLITKKAKKTKTGKDEVKDGKAPDKRADGNDYAKSEGDDRR